MQESKGMLDRIKLHDKINLRVTSNENNILPEDVARKFIKPLRLSFYLFMFIEKGAARFHIDSKDVDISAGQLLLVLPNQIFLPPPALEGAEYFKIAFDENTLTLLPERYGFLVNPADRQVVSFEDKAQRRVRSLFSFLDQLLHSESRTGNGPMILAYLNALLAEINGAYFRNVPQVRLVNNTVTKFMEFKLAVETHLTGNPSVHAIAEELALTQSSLYEIVKENSGISPKEFITIQLIKEAQRKLHFSNPSIKELAYELGYSDPGYFSRLFKKVTGKSISEYVKERHDLSV